MNLYKLYIMRLWSFTERDLIIIGHTLNMWEFPELLGDKPDWWDTSDRRTTLYDEIKPVLRDIHCKVSEYKRLKYHNIEYLGSSSWHFHKFWISRFLPISLDSRLGRWFMK